MCLNADEIHRPRLQQGERVRGEITSSKGYELITSSYYKQQGARSKKQKVRNQEAKSGSNYKQQGASFGSLGKQFGASFLWIQKGKARPAAGRRCHPSFTATVFQCGEVRFGSLGKQFGANFLWIQKGKVRPAAGRRCHPSFTATVFQCGEVRFGSLGKQFGANFLGSESDVRHGQLQAAGAIRP